jgi:hypothetical protein
MTPENIEQNVTRAELAELREAAKRFLRAQANMRDALQRAAHYSNPRAVGFNLTSAAHFTAEAAEAVNAYDVAENLLRVKL